MTVSQFLHGVGSELREFFWQDQPSPGFLAELRTLERRLRRCSEAMQRQRTLIDELRTRVAPLERRAEWLATRVEVYLHVGDRENAWRHALDLDQVRHALEKEHRQLERQQRTYEIQLAHFQQLRQMVADLQDQMTFLHA
jgi:chromosome segregation ATPase